DEKDHRQLLVRAATRRLGQVRSDPPPERVLDRELFKRNAQLGRVFRAGRGLPEYQPAANQENHVCPLKTACRDGPNDPLTSRLTRQDTGCSEGRQSPGRSGAATGSARFPGGASPPKRAASTS